MTLVLVMTTSLISLLMLIGWRVRPPLVAVFWAAWSLIEGAYLSSNLVKVRLQHFCVGLGGWRGKLALLAPVMEACSRTLRGRCMGMPLMQHELNASALGCCRYRRGLGSRCAWPSASSWSCITVSGLGCNVGLGQAVFRAGTAHHQSGCAGCFSLDSCHAWGKRSVLYSHRSGWWPGPHPRHAAELPEHAAANPVGAAQGAGGRT